MVWRMVRNERNILQTVKRRTASEIGHILRRNCVLKDAIERKKEREDEEEDVRSYWMTLSGGEGIGV
jgi:hypothetical protein